MKKSILFVVAIFCTIFSTFFAVAVLHDTFLAALLVVVAATLVYIFIASITKSNHDRVLFCDLDGTLIKTKSGKTFPEDCNDWQFRHEVIKAIHTYAPSAIHIISNQGGMEKGFVDPLSFLGKMDFICRELNADFGISVSFDFCPHNDPNNPYRKPNPGMINMYLKNNRISSDQCLMIGDASGLPGQFSDSDLQCANNANVKYMDVEDFVSRYFVDIYF